MVIYIQGKKTFESTLLSVNSLDAKQWKTGYIYANTVVMLPTGQTSNNYPTN